jgi:carbon storage regulator
MLVLSRRIGEEIVIAENIRLTVLAVKGGQVQIGVAAPSPVTVDRKEVHDRRVLRQPGGGEREDRK